MKPVNINKVLDLALEARKRNEVFNPLFTGDAGLGKSQICQQWVKKQRETDPNFGFVDLRIAYYEAPDMVGFPKEVPNAEAPDGFITVHCLPDFWPRDPNSKGLLLLEEPNRGTVGVMNCLMQLLTDRKVKNYNLPEGWIIAGCVNPDSAEYAVNKMDTALKDRFEEYEIEFDHNSFVSYIEKAKWDEQLINFVKSGTWMYKSAKELDKDKTYISPRTLSKINAAEKAGLENDRDLHFMTARSILGKEVGKDYHKFRFDEAPVLYSDLLENKKAALKRLKKMSSGNDYKGDMVAITVESITKHFVAQPEDDHDNQLVGEDTMGEVAETIPADQAVNLIKQCAVKASTGNVRVYLSKFVKGRPKLVDVLKSSLAADRATKK